MEIVSKYNAINDIFNGEISYNKKELAKIVEGTPDYTKDSNEQYNDYFFEISMGVRLLSALKDKNAKINLDGICDVIINNEIAIECKYIHSPSNIVKNIQTAKHQIQTRVDDKQANCGFIALDLSHICPREKILEYVNYTLDKFITSYTMLSSKGYINGNIVQHIIDDKNFSKIICSYIMMEVETCLYSELGFSYDLGKNTLAIIFQSINSFVFVHENQMFSITTRGMTYFVNDKLPLNTKEKTINFIHSLAVGI
ncbi:MAG: hypothetical protein RLZZ352_943 [Pseudomonadota bacterium]